MLPLFRHIIEELKEGKYPAYIESLDKAIDHFEKQIQDYPWQSHTERTEAQSLLGELYQLRIRNSPDAGTAEKPSSEP